MSKYCLLNWLPVHPLQELLQKSHRRILDLVSLLEARGQPALPGVNVDVLVLPPGDDVPGTGEENHLQAELDGLRILWGAIQ